MSKKIQHRRFETSRQKHIRKISKCLDRALYTILIVSLASPRRAERLGSHASLTNKTSQQWFFYTHTQFQQVLMARVEDRVGCVRLPPPCSYFVFAAKLPQDSFLFCLTILHTRRTGTDSNKITRCSLFPLCFRVSIWLRTSTVIKTFRNKKLCAGGFRVAVLSS